LHSPHSAADFVKKFIMQKTTSEEAQASSWCLPCCFVTAALSDQTLNGHTLTLHMIFNLLCNVNYMIEYRMRVHILKEVTTDTPDLTQFK